MPGYGVGAEGLMGLGWAPSRGRRSGRWGIGTRGTPPRSAPPAAPVWSFEVEGVGFRVLGLEFGVEGVGFRVLGMAFGVGGWDLGLWGRSSGSGG